MSARAVKPGAVPPGWRRPLTIGFALVAGALAVLLVYIFRPLVRPVLWATALALLVYPAHRRLLDRVGGSVTLAAWRSAVFRIREPVARGVFLVRGVGLRCSPEGTRREACLSRKPPRKHAGGPQGSPRTPIE